MQTIEQAQKSVKNIINNYRNHPTCTSLYWENTYQTINKITPLEASVILDSHHIKINRKEKKGRTQSLNFEINQGRWVPVISSIKFSTKGKLIDGQHRLNAIAQQKENIQIIIQHNVPERVIHFLDTNANRTAADMFMFSGQFKKASVARDAQQLTSLLVFLKEKGFHLSTARKNSTSLKQNCTSNKSSKSHDKASVIGKSYSEYLNYYKEHRDEINETLQWIKSNIKNKQKLLNISRISCAYHLFRFIDKIAAQEYIKNIFNQTGLEENTTTYRVYQLLLNSKNKANGCELSGKETEETLYNGFWLSHIKKEKHRKIKIKFAATEEIKNDIKNGNYSNIKFLPSREIYSMFKEKYNERLSNKKELSLDVMLDYSD